MKENHAALPAGRMEPVVCTECGSRIDNKFFSLEKVVARYDFPGFRNRDGMLAPLRSILSIGAVCGGAVLAEAPSIHTIITGGRSADQRGSYDKAMTEAYVKKYQEAAAQRLPEFECGNDALPLEQLKPVRLSIDTIVGQFCRVTGFWELYQLLRLQPDAPDGEPAGEKGDYNELCRRLMEQPGVRMEAMSEEERRLDSIRRLLYSIRQIAIMEHAATNNGSDAAVLQQYRVGWRYRSVNGRAMPYQLVICSMDSDQPESGECCCPVCHRPLSYQFGAWPQRIVGVLGTQSTGKTTYLAALVDALDEGEGTTIERGGRREAFGLHITPGDYLEDPQWGRFRGRAGRGASGGEDIRRAGPLTVYRDGIIQEKTRVGEGAAFALNFVVESETASVPAVMYTVIDIPGEAFYDDNRDRQNQEYFATRQRILRSSDALFMVVNCRQTWKERAADLETDPVRILSCYEKFLPTHPIPTAIVLTASDLIGTEEKQVAARAAGQPPVEADGSDLRRGLHVGYDIRRLSPLVDTEEQVVYNVEAMSNASGAVSDYLQERFGRFIDKITELLQRQSDRLRLAAFAVSNGTQHAQEPGKDAAGHAVDPSVQTSGEACAERLEKMRRGRFGVTAPLLWLLAQDGFLPVGRRVDPCNNYTAAVQTRIGEELKELL